MSPQSRFQLLEEYVSQGKLISGDKFLYASQSSRDFIYFKRDFLYRSGHWRGRKVKAFALSNEWFNNKPLVVGHSDLATKPRDVRFLKLIGVPFLFGVNTIPVQGLSTSIPLGLTNDCDDSPIHRIFGNELHFLRANNEAFHDDAFDGTVYMNFSENNNPKVRNSVSTQLSQLVDIYKIVKDAPAYTNEGRVKYLAELRRNAMVICPEGNGVDTHRLWETLYMGGIPVVTENRVMNKLYEMLPVICLKSWSDFRNRDHVEQEWHRVRKSAFDYEILSADFWINLFASHTGKLD